MYEQICSAGTNFKRNDWKSWSLFIFATLCLRMKTEIPTCVLVIMTKNREKVVVAFSPCVRRFCAKSINKENNPHIIQAPTLHSHIHRLFTAQIFIRLCSCKAQKTHSTPAELSACVLLLSTHSFALWFLQIDRKGTPIETSKLGQYH